MLPISFLCVFATIGASMIGCGPNQPTSTSSQSSSSSSTASSTSSSSSSGGQGGAGGTDGTGGQGGGTPVSVWTKPACSSITGTSAVTFTSDEGATLAPTPGQLQGIGYTFGLAALDTPNTLLAEHKGILLRSKDAGCTWTEIGQLAGGPFHLTAAKGGIAYAWSDNGSAFYRIDDSGPHPLTTPAMNVVGVGVDPKDGLHLRIGDSSGFMSDSTDGGDSWTKQGSFPAMGIGYRFAFDPADLDHVLFGQSSEGATVSFDGGATVKPCLGIDKGVNAFSLVVSPVDKNVVWAQGKELASGQAHVYRSNDGGLTFTSVVTESAEIFLVNGTLLAAHAANPDVLYFVFGTYFNNYGTDLYRYDQATGMVTKTHNAYDEIGAIVASPADPSLLYLGLTVESIL